MNPNKMTSKTMMQPIASEIDLTLKVNGITYQVRTAPATKLIHILRDKLKLTGTKISCEIGRCGACSVEMNGKLVNSCLVMAYQANGASIHTIEGVAQDELDPIQQAFLEEGGFQCGYCTPGMIIAARALLRTNPNPSPDQITEALSGNLCRCTGYGGIIRSVEKAAAMLNERAKGS
ncbi:(2Fe-2S)-binding protein [Neobacillus muris]|uniref:(2Fe-2S)-binding protein n=1 Tax=Neobacillus muris TaxID=2941334 RepID=UPI00203BE767|nr:(2Fe-2S)-binding protein [Neobacillus muris]